MGISLSAVFISFIALSLVSGVDTLIFVIAGVVIILYAVLFEYSIYKFRNESNKALRKYVELRNSP